MTATPTPSSVAVRLPAGFEFVRMLGRGGNGYVVCARQVDLDRHVAVKMILGGTLAAGGLARLQREGRALARLAHPNVVRVYAALPVADDLALVLELVDGPSLETALASGGLSAAATFTVLSDVAAALEHCGERGIVHRDLKPGNILLTQDGRAKVADFGLARLSRNAAEFRTAEGVASGTPSYMAPEQLRDPDREDSASDSWSFAVVAYRALTGRLPSPVPGQPPSLLRGLDPRAAGAFLRALSEDPRSRLAPRQLLTELLSVPTDAWVYEAQAAVLPGGAAGATHANARDRGTLAEVQTSPAATAPFAGPAVHPLRGTDAAAVEPAHPWLDVPVYAPPRSRRSLAVPARFAGMLAGVVIVLLVIALARG